MRDQAGEGAITSSLVSGARMDQNSKQKRSNLRLAIILAALALGIFGVFIWSNLGGVN